MSEVERSEERGTLRSYITGFALSLIFTAIPYVMVVNHSASGSMLLATILSFAFLQMAVQIFFFLHLGRGPKPLYNVGFFVGTFGAILVVVVGSIFIMSHLHNNMSPDEKSVNLAQDEAISQVSGEKTGACQGVGQNHKVTITAGVAVPGITEAHLCDTLTLMNMDDVTREITFGTHPAHAMYAGESELSLRKDHGKTITLFVPGTYQYHDHLDPGVAGTFSVSPE